MYRASATNLKRQPRLDLLRKHIGDGSVKVGENLHGKLGLYSALGNKVVQRVCERAAQAAVYQLMLSRECFHGRIPYLLRR